MIDKNKYEIISEAFIYLKNLDSDLNFFYLNHLMHYGIAVKKGIDFLDRMLKKTVIISERKPATLMHR